jgi:RNA polymerase primary sigma factor
MAETMSKLFRRVNEFARTNGREPTEEEISRTTKLPIQKVRQILMLAQQPVSLEAARNDESDGIGQVIADPTCVCPDVPLAEERLGQYIAAMLRSLTGREKQILCLRFGISESHRELTLEEIGRMLGLTRERIRQIEQKALLKLRRETYNRAVRDHVATASPADLMARFAARHSYHGQLRAAAV